MLNLGRAIRQTSLSNSSVASKFLLGSARFAYADESRTRPNYWPAKDRKVVFDARDQDAPRRPHRIW